jgi:hypothetical protein
MKTRYELGVMFQGRTAKNKAIIVGRANSRCDQVVSVEARDAEEAYKLACVQIKANDPRPVAGKSYIRNGVVRGYQVGDRVKLVTPYQGCSVGTVCELVGPEQVCVTLDGYHNPYVDFNLAEIAGRL